jgi:hypothetical protein
MFWQEPPSAGIEPANFDLVGQRVYHLSYRAGKCYIYLDICFNTNEFTIQPLSF